QLEKNFNNLNIECEICVTAVQNFLHTVNDKCIQRSIDQLNEQRLKISEQINISINHNQQLSSRFNSLILFQQEIETNLNSIEHEIDQCLISTTETFLDQSRECLQ
ncbi:unnamed protein product, partial [Didymodactylos carnosus]